jgi:hypothetical protein
MMRPVGEVKVYLHRAPIDMRKGRNGLAALVREAMQQDPFAPEALYVFVARRYEAQQLNWLLDGYDVWSAHSSEESEAFLAAGDLVGGAGGHPDKIATVYPAICGSQPPRHRRGQCRP